MDIPVFRIDDNKFQISIDTSVYSKEAITASLYKYSNMYYVYEERDLSNDNYITVTFESKGDRIATETTPKAFCNDLIDQQIRIDVVTRYGHIRDQIVEEAFKPVNTQ